ncbi:MAG: CHAD domain-containing protein [Gallionella sp.]|nr:CHAD domain-containing protein [Gallionella sp.]
MSMETELKLRITPEHLARLRRHPLFRTHQISAPVTRHLHNIYYDTPKLDLHNKEMALRLRRAGGRWLQTLKGGGSGRAGLHQRNEWEAPVALARLDFSVLQASVLKTYLPPRLRNKLKSVFVTDFYRTSRLLEWRGAQIEVCMDHGVVKTAQHSTPICEVELELKSGAVLQLYELALALLEIVPLELETVSKAEQGFRLLSGYIEQPIKAKVAKLGKTDSLIEVLQTLIWSCLLHLQNNLHGAMTSDDAEYLHQMRVALRRLRVVLRMAEKFRYDAQLAALRDEFAILGTTLGKIREWDVFIAGVALPLCATRAGDDGLQTLLSVSERQRTDSYALLRGIAQRRQLQRLMLSLAIWMNGDYWQQAEEGAPQTQVFAVHYLQRLEKRYKQRKLQLDATDSGQLHALRILAKKLRYSAECYSSLYGKKEAGNYLSALAEVQEKLGEINDVAVAHRLLDELAENPQLSAHQASIASVRDKVDNDFPIKIKILHNSIQSLDKQCAFWKK